MRLSAKLTTLTAAIILAASAVMAAPQVRWTSMTHDFGAFDEDDGTVTCTFTYVNDGDEPLSIISARATCGCTTPRFTAEAVAPGQTGTVSVSYNPTGRPGRFDKKVYIDMNTEPKRSTLNIRGVVIGSSNTLRSRFPVDAGAIKLKGDRMMFGEVKTGRAKTQFLDIYNATSDTVAPVWHDLPPYLSVTPSSPVIAPGEQETYSLYLLADKTGTYGMITDTIGVSTDADPRQVTPVEIVAIINEDFSMMTPRMRASAPVAHVSTDHVDFDRYAPGTTQTATVTLTNRGKDRLTVRRAYSLDPSVSVAVSRDSIKKGKSADITVTVDPYRCADGVINARVQIITNDPDNPVINVRVTGLPASTNN